MNDRFRLQLKLQQAVKIVSIGAITYYLVAILHLIFVGVHAIIEGFDPDFATAVSVPFVLAPILWHLSPPPRTGGGALSHAREREFLAFRRRHGCESPLGTAWSKLRHGRALTNSPAHVPCAELSFRCVREGGCRWV